MDEELMKAIEQAAAQADTNQEHMEIEAFINHVSDEMRISMSVYLSTRTMMLPAATRAKVEAWQESNRQRIALQVGSVVRTILSKELLSEN